MQPSTNNERLAGNLPTPVPSHGPETTPGPAAQTTPEIPAGGPESAAQSLPVPAGPMPAPSPLPTTPAPVDNNFAATNDVTATTDAVVPASADDADLIEKEWVARAKGIVEKTQNDPYQQSKELTVFKADYMKKRYNKTIKLSE